MDMYRLAPLPLLLHGETLYKVMGVPPIFIAAFSSEDFFSYTVEEEHFPFLTL